MMKYFFAILSAWVCLCTKTYSQTSQTLILADSLAKEILENEGLYTVMGGLKPISTVLHFQFEIDSVSQAYESEEEIRARINGLTNALNLLEKSPIGFITIPFRQTFGNERTFEVIVYYKDAIFEKIREHESFFLQRGLSLNSPIEQILTQTEFDYASPRYRAYGYFFGYPDHAVDFFVEAAQHEKDTKEFVKRDFFQIPVSSRDEGAFVYAVPKGYQQQEVDSLLKDKAIKLLEIYQTRKNNFMKHDHHFPYLELYWDMVQSSETYKTLSPEIETY